jgi:N-acetylmuramoyl-L-alanine amidase
MGFSMAFFIDSTTWQSPNYDRRHAVPISAIVCHSCEGALPTPRASSLPWLCSANSRVSAHYYVCRSGRIYQLVDDADEAWHAGECQHAFSNARSLGVECEHRSGQDWPPIQHKALAWLLRRLIDAHHIAPHSVETHGQIALPGPYDRKHDPSDWPHADFRAFVAALAPDPPAPDPHAGDTHYRVKALATAGITIRSAPRKNGAVLSILHAGDSFWGDEVIGQLVTLPGFGSTSVWVRALNQSCVWSGLLEKVED